MSKPETLKNKMRNGGYGTDDTYTYSSRNNNIGSYNGTYSRDVDTLKKRASSYTIDSTYEEEKKKREEQRKKEMQAHAEAMRKAPSVDSYAAQRTQANLKAPAYNSEPVSNIPSIEDYVKSKQKVAPAPMTKQEFERRKGANGGTISVRGKAYSNYEDYVDSIENPDYENMVNRYNQAKSDTNKAALNVAKKAVTGTGTEADAQVYMDAKEREKALKRDIEYTGASVREAKNFAERQHQDRKLEKTAEEYGRLDESTIKLLDDVNEAESATDSSAASYFAGAMTGSALGNIDLTDYTHSEAYAKLSEMGYNKEQIDALRRYRSAELNKAKTETRQEIIDELYDSGDDASNRVMGALQNGTMQVAGTVASAAPKLLSPLSLVERYKAWETDTPVDLNSPYNTPANYANELREGVMERHDWNVGKVDMFDMLYGTATSTLDSVVAGMLPGISVPEIGGGVAGKIATKALQGTIGGGLIGVEAAVDTMNDLTEKGASSSEAFTGGLVAGAFEGLFESFSIGEFKALQESGKVGIKNVLVDLAKSAGVNASEEGLTEIANIMYDTLANGDLSDYQAKMNEYIQSGMSEEEAKSQVVKDFAFQVIEAAAGGALQGLLMGGVGEGINYANYGKAGSEISGNQQAGELVEAVQKNFADDDKSKAKSMADKYAERIKEGKKVSDTKLGQLQYEATLESENKAVPEKVKASDVEREITQKLADAGKTTSIAPEVAKIAAKEINGEKLTARETDILDNVTEAQEVVSSLKDNQVEKFFRNKITASQIASIGRSAERESSKSQRIDYTNPEVEVNGKALRVDGGNIKKGDVFRFNGVFKDSDGDNAIKLANGQEMKLSKLTFKDSNSEGARLYQKAANMSTELANIYIDQYDGQLLGDYEKAFDQLTALGKLGTDAQAIANTSAEYNPTRFFDASAVGTILKEGLKSKEFKSGLTNYATNQELISKVGKGTFAIVDRIAKDTGLEIFLFDSLGKRGTSQYNGAFVGENRIMLSLDADGGLLLRTIGHEQTHFLKRYNAKGYQRLADRVVAALEKKGGAVSDSLKKFKEQGYKDNEQLEELIADSLFKAYDSDFIRDLAKNDKDVAEALGDNLDEVISSIEAGVQSLGQSGNHKEIEALNDDLETLKDIQKIFHEELKVASAEYQKQRAAGKTDDAGISLSTKSTDGYKMAQEALGSVDNIVLDRNNNLVVASNRENVMFSVKTLPGNLEQLRKVLFDKGFSNSDIDETVTEIKGYASYLQSIADAAEKKGFPELKNNLYKDVVYVNPETHKQAAYAFVKNGDYPANIDLMLICKKRVEYGKLISYLAKEGILNNIDFRGAAIAKVNTMLRDEGFETACLGCFVEARRLQIQNWAETVVQEWNAEVEKYNVNAPYFNFAKNGSRDSTKAFSQNDINDIDKIMSDKSIKHNEKGNLKLGGKSPLSRASKLIEAVPAFRKKLQVEDLINPDGLLAIKSFNGGSNIFSFVVSRYGANSPKYSQEFNAYNGEILGETFKTVSEMTGEKINGTVKYLNEAKKELVSQKPTDKKGISEWNKKVDELAMRKYLLSVGGNRIQSFSDFMIENVLDYIQLMSDTAAKEYSMHGYTKEATALRLFGMTGTKWNGSLIASTSKAMGQKYAGLLPASAADNYEGVRVKVDGKEYAICFDDYDRHTKYGTFVQSIGMKDIFALQCDPRYSKNVGSITIGVSDIQIRAMLNSPLFRMVIPYHKSGMMKEYAELVGADMYNDYSDYQETKVGQIYDLDGKAVDHVGKGKSKDGKDEYPQPSTAFKFNEEIHKHNGDAKAAAKAYIDWCRNPKNHPIYEGRKIVGYAELKPKFSDSPYGYDFTQEENYYKLLEDFNVYDSVTGEIAEQGAVQMTMPSESTALSDAELKAYEDRLRSTGVFSDDDIKKYVSRANWTFKDIVEHEIESRARYNREQNPKRDALYKKIADVLLSENARTEQAESVKDYLDKKSKGEYWKPVAGTYGLKRSTKDTDYMKAAESGDTETAQKMVDEAAKAAGYTVKAYHGTTITIPFGKAYPNSEPFFVFNTSENGIHFGNEKQAKNRMLEMESKAEGGGYLKEWIFEVYLNLGKAKTVNDANLNWENEIKTAISEGYDSLIYENRHEGDGLSYCVFSPSQIKSADPITYDNNGNIIPLSERFNEQNDDIRYSTKDGTIADVASSGDYSMETDSDVVINDLRNQNDFNSFIPSGLSLSNEFIGAIKNNGNFAYPRLYRGMDANEYAFIRKNGYIKSNSSYNFENQQGQTLFSNDPRYAFGYATSFAPTGIRENYYEKGQPSYLVEIANSPDLNIRKDLSLGNEEYTYGEIDGKYITRVFEIRYDSEANKNTMKDVTAESGIPRDNSQQAAVVHGVPDFYRDKTTGTILYNVQDEYGFGTDKYISEAEPGLIIDFSDDGLENAPDYEFKYKTNAAKISGKYSDLELLSNMSESQSPKSTKDYTETVKLGMNNTEYKATPRTAQFLKERKNATTVDDYGKKTYFDKLMSLYRQYQEGTANKDNFFKDTIAVFKPTQRPKRSPDYVSHNRYGDVSSEYWYTDRGVIRGSNHWGIGIRSCDWALEGIKYGETSTGSKYYGKADWNDILYQTNWKANSDGKTVDLRSFASEARDAEEMENGTMRFSTKDQATDVQRYYEDVIKENRQLQNILSNLDFDTDTLRSSYSLDSQEVNKLANKILRENYSKDENFSKALNTVFDYMLQGEKTGRFDTDAAVQYLMQACTTMLEKSERIDDEAYEETKSIREYLRKVGVTVPENDWNNLVSEFGDAQSFQRATFGRLKVRKGTDFRNDALNGKSGSVKNIDFGNKAEALPVDTLYQELSEEYPGYFDDTIINKYDQVKAIVHFVESTKKKVYQPFGEPVKYTGGLKDFSISARQGEDQMYLEQKAADVAMQLMSEYQKLTRVYTDKQKNELYRREVDEKYRNFKRTFLQNEREKNRQLLSKKKEDVFQWYNTRLSQYKEGRENTEIRRKLNNSIDRAWNYLNTRLEEKSKSKHIPDGFDGLVRDVLKAIPGGVGNDRYAYFNRAALTNLASTYKAKALEVYGTDEKGNASNEDVAELISDFDEFIKSVADDEAPPMRRKDLNMAQVRILNNLISNVKHLVDRQNKLFGEGRQEDINELAQSVLNDYRGKDESIFQRGTEERKAKLLDLADDFRSGLTKPEYLFKESGSKALYDLYKDVRRGENAEGRVIYDAKEFLVNAKAKYNYDPAWETRTVDVPVLNANPVKITQQDAMYIYALSRRKQGRMHLIGDENWNIMGGGVRVTNAVTGKKVNVKLTPQALVHIESQLNDNQRNYVQAVVEYLSKDVAKSRNNTSMEIMGFEKYGETNYIPIRVYKGTLQQNANRPESLGTIANQGASKTLKKKAVNAIDVSGFDDVVSDHIYQSALYCGYATATENFNRVWNNKTDDGERVHGVVEKYLGKNITEYMHNFMVDVNSGQITAKQMALPNRLMGYAKKAATMANISVVVQQPTAVFRAMLYIEPKYFATVASKSDLEEMYKYNGCALKKDIGYFDVNVGRSVTDWLNEYKADDAVKGEWSNAEKWKQFDLGGKIEDLAGWGANKADEITWGAIWNACKKKVAAEQNLSGDALIEKASELFQDTVALTQVYDSVFTKCDYMRRKEGLAQMATAFMSEPITSLNMLMDAKRQIRDAKTDEQKRKARGFTVRAFACFAAATVANAMCKSFIQVLRDDDEEKDFLVKYLTKVVSNIFGDVTGMVPYISDIISMLQGYDPTRLDTQALSKTVSTLQYISKQIKSDDPDYEKIISNGFNMVAQWTGYPVYNVYRDSKAVVDKSTAMIKRLKTKAPQVEFTGHDLARSLEEEFEFLPGVTAKIDYSKYVDDYLAGKIKKVDRVKRDIDDDKITQVTSAIGKKYRAGRISRDDAKRALEALSGKNSEAADSYLKSQDTRMKKESE